MTTPNATTPASWRPDEPAAAIFSEDAYLQGTLLMCIAYGGVATLSVQCFSLLARAVAAAFLRTSSPSSSDADTRKPRASRAHHGPLLAYVLLIFALSTAGVGMAMRDTMLTFVNDRAAPSGPLGYLVASSQGALVKSANATIVLSTFFSDALLLWRCTVICWNVGTSRTAQWTPIALALAFWFTEFILGTLFLVQLSTASIWSSVDLALAFWCFSLGVNLLATLLIAGRLLHYRRKLARVFGHAHRTQHTGLIAMFVESELLYSAFLVLYIVPFVRGSPLANAFIQAPAMVQAVSALMIVYRIARGHAWSKDTYAQIVTRASDLGMQLGTLGTCPPAGETADSDFPDKSTETVSRHP